MNEISITINKVKNGYTVQNFNGQEYDTYVFSDVHDALDYAETLLKDTNIES